ncbi:MAG: hypothetical protein PHV99_00620 [Candidatus Pacebacteria bacterium]|nr:hypothetical protein [Candidatus Paceibacterota bacterium]
MAVSRERWFTLSLADQLGNVGSEVGRALAWQGKNTDRFWGAAGRALELLDLTREDARWRSRRAELDRARESVADAILGGSEYGSQLADLERYFIQFALYSRRTN